MVIAYQSYEGAGAPQAEDDICISARVKVFRELSSDVFQGSHAAQLRPKTR